MATIQEAEKHVLRQIEDLHQGATIEDIENIIKDSGLKSALLGLFLDILTNTSTSVSYIQTKASNALAQAELDDLETFLKSMNR